MFETDVQGSRKGEVTYMERRMFESIGNKYSNEQRKGTTGRTGFTFNNSSNDSNSCGSSGSSGNNKISDLNAEYLRRTSMPVNNSNSNNYIKCSSSSSNTASIFGISNSSTTNNTNNNSNSNNSLARSTINVFSNALSHTFQNIPNTLSNLTSPFTSSSQSNTNTNSFNTVFGVNPSPNTYKPKNLNFKPNQFHIDALISNFETKVIGAEEIVYFKIDLYSAITKQEWTIYHKYSDFYELNLIFKKYYTKAPYFPGDTYLRLSNLSDLIHKKENLEHYIKDVINRSDLLTSIYCIKFLKLENHYPDIALYHPFMMYNLEDELDLPISCAYFYEETNLLFLGLGKPKQDMLSGIFTKVKSKIPFFSKAEPPKTICGQLVVYNIIKNYQGVYHFEPLYSKALYSEVSSINYYKDKNCLCVGLNDGSVQLYKVYTTESTEESKGEFIIEAGVISSYSAAIVGAVVNFNYGYIYTIAKDVYIKISELNYQSLMKEYAITKRSITKMVYDDVMGRIILGDEGGSVYVVDITTNVLAPKTVCVFNCGGNRSVCCLKYERNECRLFVGMKGGDLLAFKLKNYQGKYGEIEFMKVLDVVVSQGLDVNEVIVNAKEEMMVALNNGSIPVYCRDLNKPEFVVDAHLLSVNGMFWEEKKKMLITCSEDKSVKMCQFPVYWPGEMIRDAHKTYGNNNNSQQRNDDMQQQCEYDNHFVFNNNNNDNNVNSSVSHSNVNKKEMYSNEDIEKWSEDLDGWAYEI